MRFHVLGVSFAPTNKDYACEGFSQKVRLFCKMIHDLGHTVYHYGVEGSNPDCTENINVVSLETYNKVHKAYDYKEKGFSYFSETEAQEEFNFNAILEIEKRKQEHDFLCFSFGFPQRPIYDAHPNLIDCEIGVGFDGSFATHRVFESYSWMHMIYGKENRFGNPNLYDAAIPNYYDLNDYIYSEEKDDYFFYIARMDPVKGLEIALKSAEYVGAKLITAGVGKPHIESPNLIHVGVVDFEQRAKLMSRARATFVPTNYIEPYGSTVVESLLCGTPVISTDFGAFVENVIHGRVGYRCRTLEQFYWATKNISNIKPIDCRNYAVENYEISRIGKMYNEFFTSLYNLSTNQSEGWYQKNPNRDNLDWLNKYIPIENKIKKDNREIICFFIGYTIFNENDNKTKKLKKLAEKISKKYKVFVFGDGIGNELHKNGVEYLYSHHFPKFKEKNKIKHIILLNYIYYFIEHESSDNIFLLLDDKTIQSRYINVNIDNDGVDFLHNIKHNINKIILSEENKISFTRKYFIEENKILSIYDNLDDINKWFHLFENKINKQDE